MFISVCMGDIGGGKIFNGLDGVSLYQYLAEYAVSLSFCLWCDFLHYRVFVLVVIARY